MARFSFALALVFALSRTGTACALEIGGEGQAVIALAGEPDDEESFAAQELQRYLEIATGQHLDIVTEADATSPVVFVGLTRAAAELGIPDPELGRSGFIVQSRGDDLVIAGNNGLATRYGVYELLDKIGVRWYLPTELFQIVPTSKTVTLQGLTVREVPAFEPRTYGYVWHGRRCSYMGEKDPIYGCDLWAARNLLTVDGRGRPHQHSHNLLRIIVPAACRDEHPEYFPLLKGRRFLPEDGWHNWQPCLTNPEVLDLAVQHALDYFAANPDQEMFSLGINDGYGWCTCADCLAADGGEHEFRGRLVHSGRYYEFVNEVARRVAKVYPDRLLGCIAYINVELPPDFPLEPNVSVWNTQDTAQHHDAAYERADHEMLRRWTEVCQHVGKYDYYGLTWVMPRYFPAEIARDLRFAREVGMEGLYAEDVPTWGTMGPLLWIGSRLLWDPDLDPRKLQAEFCRDCFGAAAEPMDRYFSLLQRIWEAPREGKWFSGLGDVERQLAIYPPKTAEQLEALLSEAAELTDSPEAAERVEFFRRAWEWCDHYVREADLIAQLSFEPADADSLLAATRAMRQLSQATRRRRRATEQIQAEDLLGGTVQWMLADLHRGARWDARVNAALTEAAGRCTTGLVALALERGDGQIAAFMRHLRGTPLHLVARGILFLAEAGAEVDNLVANPGFELAGLDDEAAPAAEDWEHSDACPPGWSTWHGYGKHAEFYWQRGDARSGQFCVRLQGCEDDSCFIHKVAVEPGGEYVARVYARTDAGPNAKAWMRVRWQNADHQWVVPEQDALTSLSKPRGWQPLYAAFQVPAEAAYAVILLMAADQDLGESAWFDDVTLARLPEAN